MISQNSDPNLDNVRVYLPLDLNTKAILRRLRFIIYRYGEANTCDRGTALLPHFGVTTEPSPYINSKTNQLMHHNPSCPALIASKRVSIRTVLYPAFLGPGSNNSTVLLSNEIPTMIETCLYESL